MRPTLPVTILLLGIGLDPGNEPPAEMKARVQAALGLYRSFPSGRAKIMPCGGLTGSSTRTEAEVMAELLENAGALREHILLEDQSRTTYENFQNARRLLARQEKGQFYIVTSDYHLFRARLTGRRLGLKGKGVAAPLPHDGKWRKTRRQEWCYTLDLLLGWQDPGKGRPDWAKKLFSRLFHQK